MGTQGTTIGCNNYIFINSNVLTETQKAMQRLKLDDIAICRLLEQDVRAGQLHALSNLL